MFGYLFCRNGAAIKMHDYPDRELSLTRALEQAAQWFVSETARPPQVEEMSYSRSSGWTATGRVWCFSGPVKQAR